MTSTQERKRLVDTDRALLIHPQHLPEDHREPRLWASGRGSEITDLEGRTFLDGLSGMWNVNAGHGREELAQAAAGISKGWTKYGLGAQPLYHTGNAQVGLRYEFLSEDDGSSDVTVHSISVAPGYRPTPASLVRVEYRIDLASDKLFASDAAANDSKTDQILTAELSYTF